MTLAGVAGSILKELVLIAEFHLRSAAASEAQGIVKRHGSSPTLKRRGEGWALFASSDLAARIRKAAKVPRAIQPKSSTPAPSASQGTPKALATGQVTAPAMRKRASASPRKKTQHIWSMSGDDARRLAGELRHAYEGLSEADKRAWLGRLLQRFPSVFARRVGNLAGAAVGIAETTGNEIINLARAVWEQRAVDHVTTRLGHGFRRTRALVESLHARALPLVAALRDDPANVAPDLVVATLAFYATSGGFDGDGGLPDLDIEMLGIGAHRSVFTHSIVAGALVETVLFSLLDFVAIGYRQLPANHDPRWTVIHERLKSATLAGTRGMSAGLAYHLGVDGLLQPGAYHDLPIELPMEAHQAILAANVAAEGKDVTQKELPPRSRPGNRPSATSSNTEDSTRTLNVVVGAGALALAALTEFF